MDRVNVSIRPFKSKSGHCNALISLMRKPRHIAIMTITWMWYGSSARRA